jgi:hypothetical protein
MRSRRGRICGRLVDGAGDAFERVAALPTEARLRRDRETALGAGLGAHSLAHDTPKARKNGVLAFGARA